MKQWTHIDKSTWGDGPWMDEPDKKQWVDEATSLDCLAVRHEQFGNWCGYVGVTSGHPFFGKSYNDLDLDVHGGLTFAGLCHPDPRGEGHGICHVSPHEVFWLGFDCHHACDFAPGQQALYNTMKPPVHNRDLWKRHSEDVYRDLPYVEAQCALLAKQVAQVS